MSSTIHLYRFYVWQSVGIYALAGWRDAKVDLKQCYVILDVDVNASLDEVKLSYRDLAQVWHPDRFQNSPRLQAKASEQMKQINAAYEVLMRHLSSASTTKAQPNAQPGAANAGRVSIDLPKAQSCYETAKVYYNAENYQEAIANFQTAIYLNPLFREAYAGLAFTLGECNRYEEQLSVWKHLLSIDANNAHAHNGNSWAYRILAAKSSSIGEEQTKNTLLQQSLQACRQYVRLCPSSPHSYFSLGEIYEEMEDYQRSSEAYKQVLRFDATYEHVNYNLGFSYFMLGELLLAVECFKREVTLSDSPQYAWDLLGVTYFDLGWFAQSIEAHRNRSTSQRHKN